MDVTIRNRSRGVPILSRLILLLLPVILMASHSMATADPSPACTMTGTAGPDVLVGTARADVICGLAGRDTLRGNGGADLLFGDSGDDILRAGSGDDQLVGGAGRDSFSGGPGVDRCDTDPTDVVVGCETVTPAPTPTPTPTPTTGSFPVTFSNNTGGVWANNQIFITILGQASPGEWSYLNSDGTLSHISHLDETAPNHLTKGGRNFANMSFTLDQASTLLIPSRIEGARMYVSLGSPMYIGISPDNQGWAGPDPNNPSDPNIDVFYDWYEFTYRFGVTPFGGNTTQVNSFGFPMTARLEQTTTGYDQTVGITMPRAQVFSQYAASVGPAFRSLAGPYRILAPRSSPSFDPSGAEDNYFRLSIDQAWAYYTSSPFHLTSAGHSYSGNVVGSQLRFMQDGTGSFVLSKPTSTDVVQCAGALASGGSTERAIGAQFCAAFNRGVAMDTAAWSTPSAYYLDDPKNDYAAFFHTVSIDHRAYGFAYDDVNDQSSVKILPNANAPSRLTIGIGW